MSMLDSFFSKGAFKGSKWYLISLKVFEDLSDLSNWSIFLFLATGFLLFLLIATEMFLNIVVIPKLKFSFFVWMDYIQSNMIYGLKY